MGHFTTSILLCFLFTIVSQSAKASSTVTGNANKSKRGVIIDNNNPNPNPNNNNNGYYQPDTKLAHLYQGLGSTIPVSDSTDATKQTGFVVEYQAQQTVVPVTVTPSYQQYQTVQQQQIQPHQLPINLLPASTINQHQQHQQQQNGYIDQPLSNQYSINVNHPGIAANNPFPYTGVYQAPQSQPLNIHPAPGPGEATRYFHLNGAKLIANPTLKSVPLVHTQIYHPLKSINQQQLQLQKISPFAKLALPTPPRIYTNFHPMPSNRNVQQQQQQKQQKEKLKPVHDEEEEVEEKIEDDDNHSHSRYREEESIDDEEEDYRKPFRYRHRHHDDDDDDRDHEAYEEDDDHDDYRESSYKYSESRPGYSKVTSRYKYPKEYSSSPYNKHKYGPVKHYYKTGPNTRKPNVEYKMYRYSSKSKNPYKKEFIEGNGSEMSPIVYHKHNAVKEKWFITSKTTN